MLFCPITLGAATRADLLEQSSGVDHGIKRGGEVRFGDAAWGSGLHLDEREESLPFFLFS